MNKKKLNEKQKNGNEIERKHVQFHAKLNIAGGHVSKLIVKLLNNR